MLEQWLDTMPLGEFLETHYLQKPFSLPNAARAFTPLADWHILQTILGHDPPPDLLVVRDGCFIPGAAPRRREEFEALLASGYSVVIRKAERHNAGLHSLPLALPPT